MPQSRSVRGARLRLAVAVLGIAALASQLPSPADLLSALPDLWAVSASGAPAPADSSSGRIDQLVLSGAGALVWSVVTWIAVVAVVGICTAIARRDLRAGRTIVARLLPRAARGLLVAAIGGGALAASSGCAPAVTGSTAALTRTEATSPISSGGYGVEFDLDWPVSHPSTAQPAPAQALPPSPAPPQHTPAGPAVTSAPPAPAPAPVESPAASERSPEATVIVRPGDSLWSIAAAHLPTGHTDVDVALAWPHWYAANHDLIGGDPDRIRPGWALVVPDFPVLPVSAPEEPS